MSQEGAPLVLTVVKKAEQAILADPAANHEYLPASDEQHVCFKTFDVNSCTAQAEGATC